MPLNIAVVGSGISGLSAAWLLSKGHKVTLYESEQRTGGHTNTVLADTPAGPTPVDTGFIVYNEPNYPNLTALFGHLGVRTRSGEMTFSFTRGGGAFEYSGTGFHGFFGQRSNIVSVRHWRLLQDISRFFRTAPQRIAQMPAGTTLGDFLRAEGYGPAMVEDHILPMGAAIWSTPARGMLDHPAETFVRFFSNHGLMQFRNRPKWRTVCGGSSRYVDHLLAESTLILRTGAGVAEIRRDPAGVTLRTTDGEQARHDHVVVATHADQAIGMLADPTPAERAHLSSFQYETNTAVLHSDPAWMPRRRRIWAGWNYLSSGRGTDSHLCVTYWMNRLQGLNCGRDLFVTLNPADEVRPDLVHKSIRYEHPVFDVAALKAQQSLWDIQGRKRTWFCGSYFGFGFHEDGLQSGLAVAEQLGGVRRPWSVPNESGRIAIDDAPRPDAVTEAA